MPVLDQVIQSQDEFMANRIYSLLSSPWKVYLILYMGNHTLRFGELKRAVPKISHVTLTKYLNEMERDGLLVRVRFPDPPLRTEYSLSTLGLEALSILSLLADWGKASE